MSYFANTLSARILSVLALVGLLLPNVLQAQSRPFGKDVGIGASAEHAPWSPRVADAAMNLYVIEPGRNVVQVIASGKGEIASLPGVAAPLAGSIHTLVANGLIEPYVLRVDSNGNVFIKDAGDHSVKVVYGRGQVPNLLSPVPGVLYRIGSLESASGVSGVENAAIPLTEGVISADFVPLHPEGDSPLTMSVLPTVPSINGYINTVAGSHKQGDAGDGGAATSAKLFDPSGLAFDTNGNLYIADSTQPGSSGWVREVDATTGNISTIAGNGKGTPTAPNGSAATNSFVSGPSSIAFDSSGNLYIAASNDAVIDEIPVGTTQLSVYAGKFRTPGMTGDGSSAANARFTTPISIAVDSDDSLYVADTANFTIRKITAGGTTVSTVAGTPGVQCFTGCGDGGPATSAGMGYPAGVAVDKNKNIFVVDSYLYSVRVVYEGGASVACLIALENPGQFTLSGNATSCAGSTTPIPTPSPVVGNIYTIIGGNYCSAGNCGDGGLATNATLYIPAGGIVVDDSGNIFVNDAYDYSIRKVDATTGLISAVVGQTQVADFVNGFAGDGGPAIDAIIGYPSDPYTILGLATDGQGNLFLADSGNFNVRAVTGVVPIPLATQTITFSSLADVIYGTAPITLGATTDSGLPVSYSLSSTSPATLSGSTLTITGAGTVDVTANQAGDATHSAAAPVTQSFDVGQAILTVTATSIAQPQGTALPSTLPYTITGLVNSDTTAGAPVLTTAYTTSSPVGQSYPINVAQGTLAVSPSSSAGNYTFSLVNGVVTVGGGVAQTITFPALPATITYGDKPIVLAATSSSGLPITYTATGSALVTGSVASGWTLSILGSGQGTVTATQAGNTQFAAATPQSQVFSVRVATLIVTATSFSQTYGTPLPSPLPYTVNGLVGNDSVGGAPALNTAYTLTDPVGTTDQIAIGQGTLMIQAPSLPGNYTFNLVSGTITVTKGANVITGLSIPPGNQSYGSVVTLNAKASSGLPITYSVTGNATITNGSTLTITGLGPISVTASQSGNSNYAAATPLVVNFTATQAVLNVTVGYYTRAQGAVNPTFTAAISGFVNGDANTPLVLTGAPIITTTATSASAPGTYPITPALGTLFSSNYTFAFVPGELVVTQPPSYIITASPNSLTIPIGQSGQTSLAVQAINGYQGSITFSCGQVPIGITCNFSPSTVTVTPTSTSTNQNGLSTLTISATGPSAQVQGGQRADMAGLLLLPGGLAGLLLAFHRKRISKNIRIGQLLVMMLLLCGVVGLGACGSSNNLGQAPMGNTTLLITATGTGTAGTGSQNATNILYLTVDVTNLQ